MLIILILPSTSLHEGNKMFVFCLFWHTLAFHTRKGPFYRWILRDLFVTYAYRNCPLKCFCFKVNEDSNRQTRRLHVYAANGFIPRVLVFTFLNSLYFETLHHGTLQTGSCNIHSIFCLILGSWSNDDGHVNKNGKKGNTFKLAKQQL